MATIETPPQIVPQEPPPSPKRSFKGRNPLLLNKEDMTEEQFHFLISELRDENSRSRMREAVWISIIVHMVILFVLKESPRIWPHAAVTVASPAELMNNHQLTYLDQKPDTQRVPKVESNKISDKNRMAMARNPHLRKLLDDLRDNRRTGTPGQQAQTQPQQQPMQQQAQPQQQASPSPQQTQAQLPPQQPNPFANYRGASASSAIQEAARATAASRSSGMGGEFGNGPGDPNTDARGNLDILSDTQGVDFAPYLQRVLHDVKVNWYAILPPQVFPPLRKQGKLAITFAIDKNGQVESMHLESPSGDVSLDRAAWGGISGSNPFPPLPKEFHGENLQLRFRFYYNPDTGVEVR
jgi:TonB family protein